MHALRMQLIELNRFDPAMDALLDNLPLVAKRDYPALKNICQVGLEDIHDMIAELRALNSKVGLAHCRSKDRKAPFQEWNDHLQQEWL